MAEEEQVSLPLLRRCYSMPDGKNNAGITRPALPRVIQSGGRRLSMVYSLPLRHSMLHTLPQKVQAPYNRYVGTGKAISLTRIIHDGSSPFDKAQGSEHSRGTKSPGKRVPREAYLV